MIFWRLRDISVAIMLSKTFTQTPPLIELPKLGRITLPNGKRTYKTPDGDFYPSVTTVVGIVKEDAINQWRERVGAEEANRIASAAAGRGTELHYMVERYLINQIPQSENRVSNMLFNRIRHILNRIDNIRAQEIALWSDDFMVAGTCDCVADYNNIPSIIDFKTALHDKKEEWILDYFMQATAYSYMWQERTGEEINQIVIIISSEDGSATTFVKDRRDYKEELEKTVVRYYEERFEKDFGFELSNISKEKES